MAERPFCRLFERERVHSFFRGVAKMLAHMHHIAVVTIVEHPRGNGGRGVLAVGQHSYLRGPFDEGLVELGPRPASE